jgi:N-acetylmuramic acid 6-phosphate etherase
MRAVKSKSLKAAAEEVRSTRLSPTERRNPRSRHLDKLPAEQAVALMLSEEAKVPRILLKHRAELARAVKLVAGAFRRGGRLFYVGAGTSGRLGVLDASECPPTFRASPDMVQGLLAGGEVALRRSVEGAEDDRVAGAKETAKGRVGPKDVVLGIAASGTTPFVWGALSEAKRRRATTILLCFNPFLAIPAALRPTLVIAPDLGPEVLTGSTRLKAGTATKLVLNAITTLAMVRIGKIVSNLMVDVVAGNAKLRNRAVRIVQSLTDADPGVAEAALRKSGWVIKKALNRLRSKGQGIHRNDRIQRMRRDCSVHRLSASGGCVQRVTE